ncbi:DUF484 family protein [Roseomonas sp. CECT 9278]|uniref:DUF484 family protein n=1 Tax=Roseomonas sp. CECT 9278 TaxID=2845823 RepID=UPI001E5E3B45|nr:DUF484 family protein [Roseomonas sp. CECT 9278]CAH0306435.1 hypothetical protein ROS9278_04746 [Roseomonas sp. CECT 9278]
MSTSLPAPEFQTDLPAEEVEAFLRAHPHFLAERPEIYRVLVPPRRLHGERLADHMAAMLDAERARARAMEAEVRAAIEAGRAGAGLTVRIRLAVLALMRAPDVMEAVTQEVPALLGVETCSLLAEAAPRAIPPLPPGVRMLPAGAVTRLIGRGRDAVVRASPTETVTLHAEAASLVTRDALARVTLADGPPMLIAVGAREAAALPVRQSVAVLAFLGRAVAAALSR